MATTSNRRRGDDADRPFRGRRLSWEEFARLTGREPPAADNDNADGKAAPKPYITDDDRAAEAALESA
jgi:hypothetical protein